MLRIGKSTETESKLVISYGETKENNLKKKNKRTTTITTAKDHPLSTRPCCSKIPVRLQVFGNYLISLHICVLNLSGSERILDLASEALGFVSCLPLAV